MIAAECFDNRKVAVFGLGRSGISACRSLAAGGAEILAWDDDTERRAAADDEGFGLVNLQVADWSEIEALVLSPGVPLTHPAPHPLVKLAREHGVEVIGDIELFARSHPCGRVIAVTGTNGKSTTTALIGDVLSGTGFETMIGGNIGTPALSLDRMNGSAVYVLELSSYQIELAPSLVPDVAVLLNLSPDHLDRHGDMARYTAIKQSVFRGQSREQGAVIGVDDEHCQAIHKWLGAEGRRNVVPISTQRSVEGGVYVSDGILHDAIDDDAVPRCDLRAARALPGSHNWQNAAAAYAVARTLGIEGRTAAEALLRFPGLAHRMELVREIKGIRFVNDSKATNAEASARALACYDRIYWIAGGQPKPGGIGPVEPFLDRVAGAYLIGEAANRFAAVLDGRIRFEICQHLETAIYQAYADAAQSHDENPVVLLSPACASFDQFQDFEARGDAFRAMVNALPGENGSEPTLRAAGGRA
jgi:UDP-N-acetylmuramoylalanine--D-glutamate ligase